MVSALEFAEAVRNFKRACRDVGITPMVVGLANGAELKRLELVAETLRQHPESAPVADLIGGYSIEGVDFKRVWGR